MSESESQPKTAPSFGSVTFLEAGYFCKLFRHLEKRLNKDWLKPLAASFSLNMERVVSLHSLPLELLYWQSEFHRLSTEYERLGGREADPTVLTQQMDEMMRPKFGSSKEDWVETLIRRGNNIDIFLFFERSFDSNTEQKSGVVNYLAEGLDSLLSMMLSSSYAAFETLVSDSWVEAVNNSKTLRLAAINNLGEKTIRWSSLVGYEENLSRSVGKILRETQKVSFDSLGNIRSAYRSLFGEHADDVFTQRPDIVKAEQVRHLIAHKSGVVDNKFQEQTAKFPDLCCIPIGEHLPITSEMTRDLVECCVRTAIDLISLIDEWPNL